MPSNSKLFALFRSTGSKVTKMSHLILILILLTAMLNPMLCSETPASSAALLDDIGADEEDDGTPGLLQAMLLNDDATPIRETILCSFLEERIKGVAPARTVESLESTAIIDVDYLSPFCLCW